MTKPFAKFRVYPDKKRYFYFEVLVFASRRDMFEHVGSTTHHRETQKLARQRKFNAVTLTWTGTRPPSARLLPQIGQVVFHRRRTGTGTVSHEMTHAASHYVRVAKLTNRKNPEEELARTVGLLTRQFFIRY